jgi:hypothetical protein
VRRRFVATIGCTMLALAACGGDDTLSPMPPDDGSSDGSADVSLTSDGESPDAGDVVPADASLDALGDGDADLPGPSGGHALLPASNGTSATQVLNWEVATHTVFQTVAFDRKDIVVFGRRGIVRYLDPEHGKVIYPDEGYNYVHVLSEVDVNETAVPPGFSADPDGGTPAPDAGASPPYATVPVASVPGPTKADFVVSRERNDIVIVSRPKVTIFQPTGTLDLSSFVDPEDHDGKIDPVDALFDPASGFIFVLLARIDRTRSTWPETLPSCDGPTPLLVALQPVLRTIVDLTPALGTGTVSLLGRTPVSVEVEPDGERIFVLSAGCVGEGGTTVGRGIEVVDLDKRRHEWFLDLGAMPRPTRLAVFDFGHALVEFEDRKLFRWTTSKKTLDKQVLKAPYPYAPIAENWVIGFEPGTENLVLVDTYFDKAFPQTRSAVSLPGGMPHGAGYGWR